ncbi:MAG: DUF4373 domain-containing protein [Spirochaetaceae bacterium]|nr:DUF4373 domain-containing protein [Spirochaetaceae bacterium]
MKDDLPYFPHYNDARNHPKMRALRTRFGWAGYGQFWALNEMIADAPDARLDLSKKINLLAAAGELGFSMSDFVDFLAFLSDPEIDLVNYVDGIVTTDKTQEAYEAMKRRREAERGKYDSRRQNSNGNADSVPGNAISDTGNDTKQSKAKQSKANEKASCAPEDFCPKSEESDIPIAELYAFALKIATEEKHARNPPALAKKLMTEPDIIARFEASRPQPKRNDVYPEPGPCTCGGAIQADRWGGTGQCKSCGTWWRWSKAWETWEVDDSSPPLEDSA